MTRAIKTVHPMKTKKESGFTHLTQRRPVLCWAGIFIGAPLLTLLALFAASSIVMLPVTLFCGWL